MPNCLLDLWIRRAFARVDLQQSCQCSYCTLCSFTVKNFVFDEWCHFSMSPFVGELNGLCPSCISPSAHSWAPLSSRGAGPPASHLPGASEGAPVQGAGRAAVLLQWECLTPRCWSQSFLPFVAMKILRERFKIF